MNMKNLLIVIALIFFFNTNLNAQKVAQYSFGKDGTDNFKEFEFWCKGSKRTDILYAYGKNEKEVKLKYLGLVSLKTGKGFKIQFSNGYTLFVIRKGLDLKVTDSVAKYLKIFSWEYEGPVNGRGTFCSECAEDEKDAMKLIQHCYMK
jgi:hypothetical protein